MDRRALPWWSLGLLSALLVVLAALAVAAGAVAVPLSDVFAVILENLGLPNLGLGSGDPRWDAIVFQVRLPRVLGAAVIGAALAVSGTVMQGLFRNPLADPGVIGVSGGAGFGAVVAISLGLPSLGLWALPLCASLGALTAAGLLITLGLRKGSQGLFTLVLAGIAISTFFGAGTSLVLSFASRDNIAQFLFWSMGNLYNVRWESLGLASVPLLAGLALLIAFSRDLNIFLLGDEGARSLGVNVGATRLALIGLVAVTTASAVCISGPIGFVGLMVPHILRLLVGPDHRLLMPAAALGGACFLVACDLVARVALGGQELNVGIVTALVGAPYFLFLLIRSEKRGDSL